MQFALDPDHQAVRDLAADIFSGQATADRVQVVEQHHGGFDADLWRLLAESGLLGIALDEEHGGAGMGMLGLAAVLEQQGRRVAPIPLWAVLAGAALPIGQFGTDAQRDAWLPGIVDGSQLVVGAFDLPGVGDTQIIARDDDDGWLLDGTVPGVSAGTQADAFVVPFARPDGTSSLAIVPADRDGVTTDAVLATSQEAMARLQLTDVAITADDLLGSGEGADDDDAVAWTRRRIWIALAAIAAGVCDEAVTMTAAYTSQREQFGRPLSTNQGVAMRLADAHIVADNLALTMRRAAWLADDAEGSEADIEAAALVAKWWASNGGVSVVRSTQHLHGGIGADIDYPIHRYYLWGRQVAYTMGSAPAVLARLGDVLDEVGAVIGEAA